MDKNELIKQIVENLEFQLREIEQESKAADDEEAKVAAGHDENQTTTRTGDTKYLSGMQHQQIDELKGKIAAYKDMEIKSFSVDTAIEPSALMELEHEDIKHKYFMGPHGAGVILHGKGPDVLVVTPDSPLGQALVGKKVGDVAEVLIKGTTREYEILSVS